MALFDELAETILRIRTDFSKPSSFKKGDKFEKFVEDVLFSESSYILVHKTHRYQATENHFIRESSDTDFKFTCRDTNFTFWVEAKYRPKLLEGSVTLCEQWKLDLYDKLNHECPLFFILGIGEDADTPESVYLVPFTKARCADLNKSVLDLYRIPANEAVETSWLSVDTHFDSSKI